METPSFYKLVELLRPLLEVNAFFGCECYVEKQPPTVVTGRGLLEVVRSVQVKTQENLYCCTTKRTA